MQTDDISARLKQQHQKEEGVVSSSAPSVSLSSSSETHLRIVSTSDTHEKHWHLEADSVPSGDVFVHCGDIFFNSRRLKSKEEFLVALDDFNNWLGTLRPKFRYGILVIGGNHDIWLERLGKDAVQQHLTNATYLCNSFAEVCGVRFFGSPYSTGASSNAAFQPGREIDWNLVVPEKGVDVLITHQPCSCSDIASFIQSGRTGCCRLHIAGHEHDRYGVYFLKWKNQKKKAAEAKKVHQGEEAEGEQEEEEDVVKRRTKLRAMDAAARVQRQQQQNRESKQHQLVVDATRLVESQEDKEQQLLVQLPDYQLPPNPIIVNEEMESVRRLSAKTWTGAAGTVALVAPLVNARYEPVFRPIVADLPFEVGQGHQFHL